MEKKVSFINARLVKSNKSNHKVWMVTTEGWQPVFCKNAKSALKYIFQLKKSTGGFVSHDTIEKLRLEIALSKNQVSTM
ncbi:MAG: hypothetical protein K5683_02820 [Prevotella sp.]|nr:hypothetical protein [Prevotella sp.]